MSEIFQALTSEYHGGGGELGHSSKYTHSNIKYL